MPIAWRPHQTRVLRARRRDSERMGGTATHDGGSLEFRHCRADSDEGIGTYFTLLRVLFLVFVEHRDRISKVGRYLCTVYLLYLPSNLIP